MATQDISQLVVEVKSQGIQTAANQLDKLAKASDKAEAAVRKLGTSVITANGNLQGGVANASALVASMTALTAVMQRLTQAQLRTTTSTRQNNEAMREAHALARGLSGSLGALWVTYGNLAGMAAGIALGASLKGIVTIGKDVEHTLEEIRVLGGATVAEIDQMSAAISDLGKATQGPKEVAEALQVLTLAGLKATEALDGVQAALNLSVAGGIDIEKASSTLVQVSTALGYTAKDFDHVGDVIAKTAAVSMSSVDSISGAFKSAAAVGEVYGASLQDIALGLAAIANLGIGFTSAGTALKNFYKDLSASTQKVTGTLKAMGLTIADFRDSQGYMMPLLSVVEKLDTGFNKLNNKARKIAEVKMFSQQGVREFAILQKLLHTASDQVDALGNAYKSKLHEMADQINKSAAFSTLAAIAMTQTTTNQLKSVGNTLQTTFVEVFRDVAPQIGSVARAMKAAFGSPEFKAGLTAIATGVANITKFLVEQTGSVMALAAAWWGALKLAALVPAMNGAVVAAGGLAAAVKAAAVAFRGGATAAALFNLALGPIGITIAALTAAWVLYKSTQDDALNNKEASANLQEYNDGVVKAAEKEARILQLRKKGYDEAAIAREEQMREDEDASSRAVKASEKGLAAMKKDLDAKKAGLSWAEKMMIDRQKQGAQVAYVTSKMEDFTKAETAYNTASQVHANQVKITAGATERLVTARKENARLAEEQMRKNRFISPGEGDLPGKADKVGENDRYAAAMKAFQNDIKAANQDLANFREMQDAKFRAGKIGELEMINAVADKEIETQNKVAKASEEARNLAANTPNKLADVERYNGQIERAAEEAAQAERMRAKESVAAQREALTQLVNMKIKSLEDQGKYVEAANLRWSVDGKIAMERAQADLAAYGDKFPWLAELVQQYAATRDTAMNSAALKEEVKAFDTALVNLQATLKGLSADNFGANPVQMFQNATEASKRFDAAMKVANDKRMKLFDRALSLDPEAVQQYAEANKELAAMADKQKTMWKEVGETIAKSLGDAFGTAGEALGNMAKVAIEYQQTEDATAEQRLGQYGKMATAASGFFDKQSKGYRVLNTVAQMFHVASMARTLAQTAASVAAGAAQFFAQSGWAGFAGVAAMGAVMAGLGYAMSGSGGKGGETAEEVQKKQGTGGVFGDAEAKSESITKSIELLKNNSDMMLPVNQAMLESLRNIESSMTGLTNLIIRVPGLTNGTNMGIETGKIASAGNGMNWFQNTLMGTNGTGGAIAGMLLAGPIGAVLGSFVGKALGKLWGSTKQNIVDSGLMFGGDVNALQAGKGFNQYASVDTTKKSWFGLSKKTTNSVETQGLDKELSSQFGLIFTNLEETLKVAAGSLGSSSEAVEKAINDMVLETTKVSLKDLKGEELEQAINGVISKAMDDIAMAALPNLDKFRQVGEGYTQTVIRVASDIERANLAMEKLGLTAINFMDITNKTGDVAYEISKQTIALKEGESGVGKIMSTLSGSIEDVVEAYTTLVTVRERMMDLSLGNGLSFDTLKGAGDLRELNSSLSSYYDKYFSAQEKVGIETENMSEKFKALGYNLPGTREELRSWIEAAAKAGDQLKLGKLLSLAGGFDSLATSIENLKEEVKETEGIFSGKVLEEAEKAYNDALNAAETAYSRLEKAVSAEKDKIEKAKDVVQETIDGIKTVMSSLANALKATAPKVSDAEAFSKSMGIVRKAISTVNGGGDISKVSGLEDAFDVLANQDDEQYSSLLDYQRSQATANAALLELQSSGERQLTEAEKQIEKLDQQIAILDKQLEFASAELDALKGIDNSLLSVHDALIMFGTAMVKATEAKGTYEAVKEGNTGGASAAVESLYKNILGRDSDAAGKAWWVDKVNSGVSIADVTKGFTTSDEYYSKQLDRIYKDVLGRAPDEAGKAWYLDKLKTGATTLSGVTAAIAASVEANAPKFDVGTNDVPEDMLAMVHKGERIIPAADNAALEKRLKEADEAEANTASTASLEAKLDNLTDVIMRGDVANVQAVKELYKEVRDRIVPNLEGSDSEQ